MHHAALLKFHDMIFIGIDPGTHTGLAVWDSRKGQFLKLVTLPIHKALDEVAEWQIVCSAEGQQLFVVFEDARQRTWFGQEKRTSAKLQGAGSIKRDCSIWEDFCRDKAIAFRAVPPMKGGTKRGEDYFKLLTKYEGKTSNHARDAAMLVFGK